MANPTIIPNAASTAFSTVTMGVGDIAFDITLKALRVGDGSTAGGRVVPDVVGVGGIVAAAIAGKLSLTGGTLTGALAMGGNRITGLGAPTDDADAITLSFFRSGVSDQIAAVPVEQTSPAVADPPHYTFGDIKGRDFAQFWPERVTYKPINDLEAIVPYDSGTEGHALTDRRGIAVMRADPTRLHHPEFRKIVGDVEGLQAVSGSAAVKRKAFLSLLGVLGVEFYGQSNAVLSHGDRSVPGGPVVGATTTTPTPGGLMFNGGVLSSNLTPDQQSSLVTLDERVSNRESMSSACVRMIAQLLQAEDGITLIDLPHRWMFAATGLSATALQQLMEGTNNFARLPRDFSAILAAAGAQSGALRAYQPRALVMLEGEADNGAATPVNVYLERSKRLAMEVSRNTREISGWPRDVDQWVLQVSTHLNTAYNQPTPFSALAQMEMERVGICQPIIPTYQAAFDTDQLHYVGIGFRLLGAYLGLAFKRRYYDGIRPPGLRVLSSEKWGNWATLKLNPVGALAIDTTAVQAYPNYGIDALDAAGNSLTIDTPIIDPRGLIILRGASPIARVRIGWKAGATLTQLAGTNIRDSQGATLAYDPGGLNIPLHNWLPIQEIVL